MNEKPNEMDPLRAETGSRQPGDAARGNEQFYYTLSQISPVGIFRTDVHGNCLYVNERWCKITGMKQSEAIAGGWNRAMHPDDRERVAQAWYTSKHAQLNFFLEYRIRRPDGEVRWVLGQATVEKDTDGVPVGYIGTLTDITQIKESEQALRKSEIMHRTLYDSTSDAVMLLTEESFLDCNKSALEMFGCATREEFCAKQFAELAPPEQPCGTDSRVLAKQLIATAAGKGSHRFELLCKRVDSGKLFPVEVLLTAMDMDGRLVLQATARDISERRENEGRLRQSEEKLNLAQAVAQIGSWFLDIPANRLEWSQETYRMFGIRQQEAIDLQTFIEAIHPDDRDFVLKAWGEAMGGAPYDIEHRIVIGGEERWVRERARIEHDAEGRPLTGVGTVQDITDRKVAERALAESESRFREIFNTVSDAIFIHDAETGHILDVNRRMCEMYGFTREEALACGPDDLSAGTPPYSAAEAIEKIRQARAGCPQTFVWWARARDGHLFWVEVSLQFALIGSQRRILATVRDITERKKAEAALQESEYRWKFALEGSGDGLWDWNLADNTVFFSKRWKEMLGFAEDEIGNGLGEWEQRLHPDDKEETLATLHAYLDGKTPVYQSEHRVSCKDGSWKWILDRGMVVNRNEKGKPLRMIGTHADITERKQAEGMIHNLAFYDTLTQLPNRRMLNDRMSQAMAYSKRSGHYGALLFLDLDNFKPLNDTYGHAVGDLLLKEVACRISSCVREMDTVARFGGDEFVVMLTKLDADKVESAAQAGIVAEKIRITLAKPYVLKVRQAGKAETTVEHHCTSSIGVVLFINHDASPDDIIKWADMAMYRAKEDGRNLIRFHDPKV